jgi:glycosyltransferase involved in cell wall biosynthesis
MQVFKKAHAARPSLRLVVLGHFEDKLDPVSDEAREVLTTHPAIIHIDWNENVEYFMETCDLMVHASYREGFPNTLLQAGAMGIPIVCSRIEGNIDVVEDEKTGLLFRAGDAGDLSEKLEKALNDPAQMKTYAGTLQKTVREYFGQEYVHTCLRDKYLELLKNSKN